MTTFTRYISGAIATRALALLAAVTQAADLTTQDYIDIEQLYAT